MAVSHQRATLLLNVIVLALRALLGTFNVFINYFFMFFKPSLVRCSSLGKAAATGVFPSPPRPRPRYVPSFLSRKGFNVPTSVDFSLDVANLLTFLRFPTVCICLVDTLTRSHRRSWRSTVCVTRCSWPPCPRPRPLRFWGTTRASSLSLGTTRRMGGECEAEGGMEGNVYGGRAVIRKRRGGGWDGGVERTGEGEKEQKRERGRKM